MIDLVKNKDPESFDEAYNHPEADKKIMWRRAISKEFEAKGVWGKFQMSDIPNGRNCIKNKYVFRTKLNGIFLPRYLACGYVQIPGLDFRQSYAPKRVIKLILDTRMHCLKLQSRHESDKWDLILYCDSDWAGDPESRSSVTGFIIYLLGVPISPRLRGVPPGTPFTLKLCAQMKILCLLIRICRKDTAQELECYFI
jgi:hypothetical protein